MTDVDICNLALGRLGAKLIASFDDTSVEARLCKLSYPLARNCVLEDRKWSFAVRRIKLDTPDATAPVSGWAYAYTVPTTVVRVHRVDDGSGDYSLDWVFEERKVLTNAVAVYAEVVVQASEALFSPGFTQALVTRLSADLAIVLSENRQMQADTEALYEKRIKSAGGADGSQGRSERIRARSLARVR
jgi:hypothetical protein